MSVCGQLVFRIGAGGACRRPANRHWLQRRHELQGQSSPPAREEQRSLDPQGGGQPAPQQELGTSARAYAYARPCYILALEATEYAETGAGLTSAICTRDYDATNGPQGAKAKARADVDPSLNPSPLPGGGRGLGCSPTGTGSSREGTGRAGHLDQCWCHWGNHTFDCRDQVIFI